MTKFTLAEGLRELERINKVLAQRNRNISRYCSKRRGSKDEIEKQKEYVKEQSQSAADLIERYKNIKIALQKANLEAKFTFNDKEYSIAEAILYKQQLFKLYGALYSAYTNETANIQISSYTRHMSNSLTQEQLEKLDFVPELYYDEREVQKKREGLLEFMSMINSIIDKTNHSTYIEI